LEVNPEHLLSQVADCIWVESKDTNISSEISSPDTRIQRIQRMRRIEYFMFILVVLELY